MKLLVGILLVAGTAAAQDRAAREAYLDELREILPRSEAWDSWLAHTGELPPDFASLHSIPWLPDPLTESPAGTIETADDWDAQRGDLLELFHRWVIGSVPETPQNLRVDVVRETEHNGTRIREIVLRFGPDHRAFVSAEIMIPPGPGPFPVFMTQANHVQWSNVALQRGYITCTYAGADSKDDTGSFVTAWPDKDWSKLTRRAWAASRCIDYLLTLPEVNPEQIAITGHSRNGKLSLIAAAIDERIACVISSSSGAGGPLSARYFGEHYFGEGIENITRQFPDWFHPRLRFFAGREDKLPVDFHQLVALSAPRPCLLAIGMNDNVESTWAMQKTYDAVKPVYALYGEEDNLRINWRSGAHETWPTVIERYLDWCDTQFGRAEYAFEEHYVYPHDWEAWNAHAPKASVERSATLRERVRAVTGSAPARAQYPLGDYGVLKSHESVLFRRSSAPAGLKVEALTFGDYINGDVWMPDTLKVETKYPAVLWLPGMCPSTGYIPAYRRGEYPHVTMARSGYVVVGFDPVGTGRRTEEAEAFYTRYPGWSLLGKMIRDAGAALDALEALPYVDPKRIYVVGYHAGALVAAHLAALDERPAGYALISPPAPFDSSEFATRLWSRELMLLPQLERYTDAPYEIGELLAGIAPRPLLLVTPTLDRHCPPPIAEALATAARSAYTNDSLVVRQSPRAYNHFDSTIQRSVVSWLNQQ